MGSLTGLKETCLGQPIKSLLLRRCSLLYYSLNEEGESQLNKVKDSGCDDLFKN